MIHHTYRILRVYFLVRRPFSKRSNCTWIQINCCCLGVSDTHPCGGHADYPRVAADHQEDEAEQRHVPSAKKHKHENDKNPTGFNTF